MNEQLLSPDRVREIFDYDPAVGVLRWKVQLSSKTKIGAVAGSCCRDGRKRIKVDGREYMEYRVMWAWITGSWPKDEIDHIDGNKLNNAFANLREASRLTNAQNIRRPQNNNKTGFLGVSFRGNRFSSQIGHAGRTIHLGFFESAEEAHAAYVAAKRIHHAGGTL